MIRFLLVGLIVLGGCASQTKDSVLSSDAVKEQKLSYLETKASIDRASRDDFSQKILKKIEGSVSIRHGVDKEPRTMNVVIPADSTTWVVYPYEDRFGVKHNLTEVNMLIRGASWYSDHGPSLNKEGLLSGSKSDFAPYYHVKGGRAK